VYYLYRGDVYEALDFYDLAVRDFKKFRQLAPNYRHELSQQIAALEK